MAIYYTLSRCVNYLALGIIIMAINFGKISPRPQTFTWLGTAQLIFDPEISFLPCCATLNNCLPTKIANYCVPNNAIMIISQNM